ncbi:MAG: hypothetical protein U5K54_03305 [Cytophagales bacterium]|nr:hypothetical protein [Cytophagales bacterium]
MEALKIKSEIQRLELQKTRMIITITILGIGLVLGAFNLFYSKRKSVKRK